MPKPARNRPLKISQKDLADRINKLPAWARQYIHDIETNADPAGMIRELADLRFQRDALTKLVRELKTRLAK